MFIIIIEKPSLTSAKIYLHVSPRKYYTMKRLITKLQRAASNIHLINKVIHDRVLPKFADVKQQLLNNIDKHDSEMKVLYSHLLDNKKNLSSLTCVFQECKDNLSKAFGYNFKTY